MPRTREGAYTVCVYGSSSGRTPDEYKRVSRKLGNLLADGGHMTVNGAGKAGCMGALNDGVTERCGRVRGVIHEMWIVDKAEHPKVHDLKVVGGYGLQERKRVLTEDADCVIALPGGPGTWDELWEIVCLKGLGLTNLPICIIDVDKFYEGFQIQLKRAHTDKLLYRHPSELLHFESRPEAALEWCISELKGARSGTRSTTLPAPMQRVVDSYRNKRECAENGRKIATRSTLLALGTAAIAVSIAVVVWRTRTCSA